MLIDIYADTTGHYSEDDIKYANVTRVDFPDEIVKEYYDTLGENYEFDQWVNEIYECDDVDGLYDFALSKGFMPVFGRCCNGWIWYVDEELDREREFR